MADVSTALGVEDRARLDELFHTLTDRKGELAPVSNSERAARRARLGTLLGEHGLDALVVESGTTLAYLAGVTWGQSERLFALVVTADGEHFWLVPGFECSRAQAVTSRVGGELIPWQEHEYPYAPLAAALRERGCARVAVEPWMRQRFVRGLETALAQGPLPDADGLLRTLRGRKDGHELALLRRANELTQDAICAVAETLEPGVTSTEIGKRLTVAQERLGLTDIWHLALIGPAAAFPHGEDRERTLAAGDLLLVDTGGKLHGYNSDNTRSWCVAGPVSPRVSQVWNAVRDAQRAAFDVIRPGVACREPDRAARRALESAGWSPGYEHLFHRLGHGIGLDGHEDPYLDGGSTVLMEPGMCFSDEPGIYLPGELGLRIEDIVCVTTDGADHFGRWQASPASPHPA
jgi:Xaa-Pro aminopeptidase